MGKSRKVIPWLRKLGACEDALEFANSFKGKSSERAWNALLDLNHVIYDTWGDAISLRTRWGWLRWLLNDHLNSVELNRLYWSAVDQSTHDCDEDYRKRILWVKENVPFSLVVEAWKNAR